VLPRRGRTFRVLRGFAFDTIAVFSTMLSDWDGLPREG